MMTKESFQEWCEKCCEEYSWWAKFTTEGQYGFIHRHYVKKTGDSTYDEMIIWDDESYCTIKSYRINNSGVHIYDGNRIHVDFDDIIILENNDILVTPR